MRRIFIGLIVVVVAVGALIAGGAFSIQGDILIEAHFNSTVGAREDFLRSIVDLIDSAQVSLDIAIYHVSHVEIIQALNKACDSGVRVRVVTEPDSQIDKDFSSCIEIHFEENERLMHHKFMVVDENIVWTSSANWTDTSFFVDTNNALVIKSEGVGEAYLAEFEEMFSNGRFGRAKRDLNKEQFSTGEIELAVYFSPTDRPQERVIELIDGADASIELAVYSMTNDHIFDALMRAQNRGVEISAVWDFLSHSGCAYSEADEWMKSGVGYVEMSPGLLHHKFAIIDNDIVITGSANWSASGMEWNDENLVVIRSAPVMLAYQQEFKRLLQDAIESSKNAALAPKIESRHFEQLPGRILLQWAPHELGVVDGYELCRMRSPSSMSCDREWSLPAYAWYFVDDEVEAGVPYHYKIRNILADERSSYSAVHTAQTVPIKSNAHSLQQLLESFDRLEGQFVEVQMKIKEVFVSNAGNLFLNTGPDHTTDFTIFIPACALERFTGSGIDLFSLAGAQVIVSGELVEFNGPEIIVVSPWQLEVVE